MVGRSTERSFAPLAAAALCVTALGCHADRAGPSPASASGTAPSEADRGGAQSSTPGPDTLATSAGEVRITPINHATLLLRWAGKAIYVDPTSLGKYDNLPKGDVFLITHDHPDHLAPATITALKNDGSIVIGPAAVAGGFGAPVTVMKNGDSQRAAGIEIEAVPAYNLTRGPSAGHLFHDKGRGNGYVLTFGDKRIYISGDTECTPEMKALKNIDVAFVCMNLPYTMPPSEAAECVKAFRPKIVYPYHDKGSDPGDFAGRLASEKGIEVRVRSWY